MSHGQKQPYVDALRKRYRKSNRHQTDLPPTFNRRDPR